jgi:hypothetical protein
MDESVFTIQMIEQFLKFVPTPEEIAILGSYANSDISNMAKADLFLLEMMKIDRYEQRLKYFKFNYTFKERLDELKKVNN